MQQNDDDSAKKNTVPPDAPDDCDAKSGNLGDESTDATGAAESAKHTEPKIESATDRMPSNNSLISNTERFPFSLLRLLDLAVSQTGRVYAVMSKSGNCYGLPVGSKALDQILRQTALTQGSILRKHEIAEINELLCAHAEMTNRLRDVWYRVAPIDNGIEIDLGDDEQTRVRIKPGNVEIVHRGSTTLFFRTSATRSFVKPAEQGDLDRLFKYLNIDAVAKKLFLAWLTFTLAHPKIPGNGYLILVLRGDQGAGKSFFARLVATLTDPSHIGIRILPKNVKDLAIALSCTHVATFDNVRSFSTDVADLLCVAATGGALPSRKLYTDETEHVQHLHGAVVLNGIHSFITQPDLAQRCLMITLQPLSAGNRRSELDLFAELAVDLPYIMRGLFDLISEIFRHLPDVEIIHPERMLDFVAWLAAMERVDGAPCGVYQGAYSQTLHEAELDTLLDHPLAAAMLELASSISGTEWSGTPTELYERLCFFVPDSTQRSKYWPSNTIAMSKRLTPLIAALSDQGVVITGDRSKQRRITIRVTGDFDRG